jgi:hypothetical protein
LFDLEAIRAALKSNLDPLGQAVGCQVSPYMLGNPTPPTIEVMGPEEIQYDVAMQRGGDENVVVVRAFIGISSDIAAQMTLDKMLQSSGPLSVKEAIEKVDSPGSGRVTLGGLVDDLRVTRSTGYQVYPQPGEQDDVLGAAWYVQIETTE